MSYGFDSQLGEQLYQLLPEVYRTRDKSADLNARNDRQPLARYLDSHGELLDLLHATLMQQHKDAVPATSQDWLLPYFAKLLAVNIVSPDHDGRHDEVSHAIAWRQRKGTLNTIESIAEAVGQIEVEVQEGWKRVITTATVDIPYRKMSSFDSSLTDVDEPEVESQKLVRHPGLPLATIDFRRPSRAVASQEGNPASKLSTFSGVEQLWRQLNVNGVPCVVDSFDDVSRRTIDMRSVDRGGKYHHKNLLLFAAPSSGIFRLPIIELEWSERNSAQYKELFKEEIVGGTHFIINVSGRIISITNNAELSPASHYQIEGIDFQQILSAQSGSHLTLKNVQAKTVQVLTADLVEPVVHAENCLFETLSVGSGLAKLEQCTILLKGFLEKVDITNSLVVEIQGSNVSGLVQYSRIPPLDEFSNKDLSIEDSTFEVPLFFSGETELEANAVLKPETPTEILFGSNQETEIGFFCHGRDKRPVYLQSDFVGGDAFALAAAKSFVFSDLIFTGDVEVSSGCLASLRCAFNHLEVNSPHQFSDEIVSSVVDSKESVFESLTVTNGLAQLEYVTVMVTLNTKYLRASDCLFAGQITGVQLPNLSDGAPAFRNCIRYSKVPIELVENTEALPVDDPLRKRAFALGLVNVDGKALLFTNTKQSPIFSRYHYCDGGVHRFTQAQFGDYGYGVLHPLTSKIIRFGSEDGGEMGGYHHKLYSLRTQALIKKVKEFLPIGIQPVLIEDSRLLMPPIETSLTTE